MTIKQTLKTMVRTLAKPLSCIVGLGLLVTCTMTFADDVTISSIALNMQDTVKYAVEIMSAIALACGIVLMVIGILKFKAHKDQPTQIPLSTGLMYLCVGAALTMVPILIPTFNSALTGASSDSVSKISGSGMDTLIGASTSTPATS